MRKRRLLRNFGKEFTQTMLKFLEKIRHYDALKKENNDLLRKNLVLSDKNSQLSEENNNLVSDNKKLISEYNILNDKYQKLGKQKMSEAQKKRQKWLKGYYGEEYGKRNNESKR